MRMPEEICLAASRLSGAAQARWTERDIKEYESVHRYLGTGATFALEARSWGASGTLGVSYEYLLRKVP